MKLDKQKIFEIVITALISVLIALLQNLLTQFTGSTGTQASPEVAGVVGLTLKGIREVFRA